MKIRSQLLPFSLLCIRKTAGQSVAGKYKPCFPRGSQESSKGISRDLQSPLGCCSRKKCELNLSPLLQDILQTSGNSHHGPWLGIQPRAPFCLPALPGVLEQSMPQAQRATTLPFRLLSAGCLRTCQRLKACVKTHPPSPPAVFSLFPILFHYHIISTSTNLSSHSSGSSHQP